MSRVLWWFGLLVLGVGQLVGCAADSGCGRDSDCPSGRYCDLATGACLFDCVHDSECRSGSLCGPNGRCLPGCHTSSDCPAGRWCDAGLCVDCQADTHCGPDCRDCTRLDRNRVCVADRCGCSTSADCAPGESCDAGGCTAGCQPDCLGRQCGDDSCEGSCGQCDPLADCDPAGQCQCRFATCLAQCCLEGQVCSGQACCTPDCGEAECGLDGVCGALQCGTCAEWGCNQETGRCLTNQVVAMTGPDTPCGLVTCTTPFSIATAGWKAFDHSPAPFVTGSVDLPPYSLSYEFTEQPVERRILAYAILFETVHGWLNMAPRNWTLEGFNGARWVVLDTSTNQTGWSAGEVRQFGIGTPGSYSAYLLRITVTNGMPGVAIGELYLLY